MDDLSTFGEWLKRRRKQLDLTQRQLADRVGCAVPTIVKLENDERRPSREMADRLADVLQIADADRARFLQAARRKQPTPADQSSPPQRPAPRPSALPVPATPLLGREFELAEIHRLLRDAHCRLLTLVGPGGIGKTRLALQIAHEAHADFQDGAAFISLAAVDSLEAITTTVANALGLAFHTESDLSRQLMDFLCNKRLLLVLDNLEQLVSSAGTPAMLQRVLQCAPHVKVLTTSRERLNISQEWVFEVQGLPTPPADDFDPAAYTAVDLFVQSARRARADYDLRPDDVTAVGRICRLLEGLPLGIELAAAWVRALSPRDIAREIERDFNFLAYTLRDVPERHRSLQAVFDHSWRLLDQSERQALARLSVFRGGGTHEAARQVTGASLLTLLSLIDKSLLRRDEHGYLAMHELIRQYAARHLIELDEARALDQHAAYYADWLAALTDDLFGAKQAPALTAIQHNLPNLRAAWRWAAQQPRPDLLFKMMPGFYYFNELRGYFDEGEALFRQAAEEVGRQIDRAEVRLAAACLQTFGGWFTFRLGHTDQALAAWASAAPVLEAADDPAWLFFSHAFQTFAALYTGDLVTARQQAEATRRQGRRVNQLWHLGVSDAHLAVIDYLEGRTAEAYQQFQAVLEMWRPVGDPRLMTWCLGYLHTVALALGRPDEAVSYLEASLSYTADDDRWGKATTLNFLGQARLKQGRHAEARAVLQDSLSIFTEIGDRLSVSGVQVCLGRIALAEGDLSAARQAFVAALSVAHDAQAPAPQTEALLGLAQIEARTGQPATALAWLLPLLDHPAATRDTRELAEQLRAEVQAALPPDRRVAIEAQPIDFVQLINSLLLTGT